MKTKDLDVIAIQEHWLYGFEKNKLEEVSPHYNWHTRSADDDDPIPPTMRNRGHGGVAIFWKKKYTDHEELPDGSPRTVAIRISNTIVINSYLLCKGTYPLHLYQEEMDLLAEISSKY